MEAANAALVLTWSVNAAWAILHGNPFHRPVTQWGKTSILNKCHQDAHADFSLLLLSGSTSDMQGDEFPEISCCHLVFPLPATRKMNQEHQHNLLSKGLQQHYRGFGQFMVLNLLGVWLHQLPQVSQARALWTMWLKLSKTHSASLHVCWGKHLLLTLCSLFSTFCLVGSLPWYRNQKDSTTAAVASRTASVCPKSCFWLQRLYGSVQGNSGGKKLS